jgi:hypothetical protein
MSKQLKMNETFNEVTEEDLKPQEVKIEELTKEELVKLCNDKDIELGNYKTILDQVSLDNKNMRETYNNDINYVSTINSNLIKVVRRKEDAINSIIKGTLVLMTLDREEIAPERKENN